MATRPNRPIDYSQVPTYIAHENLDGQLVQYPTPPEESSGTDSYWGESDKTATPSADGKEVS